MNRYLSSYDLVKPARNYQPLYHELLGSARREFSSPRWSWSSPYDILVHLAKHIDANCAEFNTGDTTKAP